MRAMTLDVMLKTAVDRHNAGDLAGAAGLYEKILAADPKQPDAWNLLGVLAYQSREWKAAVELIGRAIALKPMTMEYHLNLGLAIREINGDGEAIPVLRHAATIPCTNFDTLFKLASLFFDLRQWSDSDVCCRRAAALQPDHPNVIELQMLIEYYQGRFAEALKIARRLVQVTPREPRANWSYGVLLLMHGDFSVGWPYFEWRKRIEGAPYSRGLKEPEWDGRDAPGKTLLLHHEGGFGDSLQYIRYVPMVRGRVGRIILEIPQTLLPLFEPIEGIDQFVIRDQPLPHFDVQISLPSLTRVLKTEVSTIPNSVPYLKAPADRLAQWAARVPRDCRLRVGLCWAGNPKQGGDGLRTLPLETLLPISGVAGVQFFSLQVGVDASKRPSGVFDGLVDETAQIRDFADTAALAEQMDLVISVDTSVAHLAGALARPVWLLTPFVSDYRWLLERSDSPWYPTMRLFRQEAYGDWSGALAKMAEALRSAVRDRKF